VSAVACASLAVAPQVSRKSLVAAYHALIEKYEANSFLTAAMKFETEIQAARVPIKEIQIKYSGVHIAYNCLEVGKHCLGERGYQNLFPLLF
jgi:hypothetical protein